MTSIFKPLCACSSFVGEDEHQNWPNSQTILKLSVHVLNRHFSFFITCYLDRLFCTFILRSSVYSIEVAGPLASTMER